MGVVIAVVGFVALCFVGALIEHDAVHLTIRLGRFLVRLGDRRRTEAERAFADPVAEYEAAVELALAGQRSIWFLLAFALHFASVEVVRAGWRARPSPRSRSPRRDLGPTVVAAAAAAAVGAVTSTTVVLASGGGERAWDTTRTVAAVAGVLVTAGASAALSLVLRRLARISSGRPAPRPWSGGGARRRSRRRR